jgi:hypothetical protein
MRENKDVCPCCSNYTLAKGNLENFNNHGFICPVCFWEIDTFISDEDEYSVSNHLTLEQAKKNYSTFGACDETMIKNVGKPTDDEG